ncbi:MAG: hypothetical protein IPP77_14635 [Bacteroidetes bacterium]|nr:hypothetical protein [Bacteroidota bacterium]
MKNFAKTGLRNKNAFEVYMKAMRVLMRMTDNPYFPGTIAEKDNLALSVVRLRDTLSRYDGSKVVLVQRKAAQKAVEWDFTVLAGYVNMIAVRNPEII